MYYVIPGPRYAWLYASHPTPVRSGPPSRRSAKGPPHTLEPCLDNLGGRPLASAEFQLLKCPRIPPPRCLSPSPHPLPVLRLRSFIRIAAPQPSCTSPDPTPLSLSLSLSPLTILTASLVPSPRQIDPKPLPKPLPTVGGAKEDRCGLASGSNARISSLALVTICACLA